ncbi:MAG: amino acid adenylation domain-containing protein [Hyphomicrobiales bacterium]
MSDTLELAVAPPAWALDAGAGPGGVLHLGQLFAFGAGTSPDKVAVDDGRARFTFAELEAMATRLAAAFAARGVAHGDRVAVISEKRAIMPAIAAAIWKLGAVYVPLDGEAPPARIASILGRLSPRLVVSLKATPAPDGFAVIGSEELQRIASAPTVPHVPPLAAEADDHPAYIIFTSGSTGEPKGVEISTGSLLAYFKAHQEYLRFTAASRVFSLTPYHFDVSIEDTLLPLSLGAFVYQFNGIVAGPLIRRILQREAITHLIAVSTILTLISQPAEEISTEKFPHLEMVMTGAEVCDPKVINLWKERLPAARLINAYGPTETTIVCTCHTIEHPEPDRVSAFPIGRPLEGVHALILDETGAVVADGGKGELCIGGVQVMRGYFDQPAETARTVFTRDGVRYYRTGDICSRQADGAIVFVGRLDDEVKIAGKRVHLGEVRQKVMALSGVDRVAIGTLERQGRREIAIVIVSAEGGIVERAEALLAETLPSYMRPTVYAHAWSVVLSRTGKTDEKKLLAQLCEIAAASRRSRFRINADGAIEEASGANA